MEIDSVAGDLSNGIVLAENILRSLLVVLVGLCGMFLALFADAMRLRAIATLVRLLRVRSTLVIPI